MSWYEISVSTPKTKVDEVTECLENRGALAISYYDAHNQPILEPDPQEFRLWESVITTGLFPMTIEPQQLSEDINTHFPDCFISHKVLPDQDWTSTWLDHFKPIQFNERLWICPTGFDRSSLQGEVLHLDPGLAFGTGQHQTTRLCLHWLACQNLTQKTVVDFGCGTGILVLAALKMGAKLGYAVDHDPQALLSTQSNAKKNSIDKNRLPILEQDANAVPPSDIVVANILMQPLIDLADKMQNLCLPGGTLLLSGILKEQIPNILLAYSEWFDFLPYCLDEEDWVLLVGKKKHP